MVGNSLRSDILPILAIGGTAVFIPNQTQWSHEVVELPGGCDGRCIQLENLSQLPELLEKLNSF